MRRFRRVLRNLPVRLLAYVLIPLIAVSVVGGMLILRALEQTQGNRTHAAKLLDLSHRALLYKIKEFGLS